MYARELAETLHRAFSERTTFDETLKRFEELRGYGCLPRGRENASVRLSDRQIASGLLAFLPTMPGWAGHVSLVLGDLRPIGGPTKPFEEAESLLDAVAMLVGSDNLYHSVVSIAVSIERDHADDDYSAKIIVQDGDVRKTVSYTSKMATSLLRDGADEGYDHDKTRALISRQLVFGKKFFADLRRSVRLSRQLDLPLKTDWREYGLEEARNDFHKKLGARRGSVFLNLAVDTQVTWPKEPTRIQFAGHHFVMFPKTKETSHSISIDLSNERLSSAAARTLLNRFLSLLSWCDDQSAVLKYGWSGNPVPVPVSRSDGGSSTASQWIFSRSLPDDPELLQRLAYFREGLNARQAGLVTFEVLSFFKVFEVRSASKRGESNKTKLWIKQVFETVSASMRQEVIERFNVDRAGKNVESYVFENCRVAIAHASELFPSDADSSIEIGRLYSAAEVVHALARHFIESEFKLSSSFYSDVYQAQ